MNNIFKRINFRQPKYMLPAILYIPLLGTCLLYTSELLSGDGRCEVAGLRERDHQRNLLGRGYAWSGHDAVQGQKVRQIPERPFKGVCHADHGYGERIGLVRVGDVYNRQVPVWATSACACRAVYIVSRT